MRNNKITKPKTFNKLTSNMYRHQVKNSIKRGHDLPDYSLEDLREWLLNSDKFKSLYYNWIKTGYILGLIPSVDRLDNSKGYSFDNIQIVTWKENELNGHISSRKPIEQYNLNGDLIKTYESVRSFSKINNIDGREVSKLLNGKSSNYNKTIIVRKGTDKSIIRDRIEYAKLNIAIYSRVKVLMLDEDLNILNTFENTGVASKFTGIARENIKACLKNKRESAGGYYWKYLTNNIIKDLNTLKDEKYKALNLIYVKDKTQNIYENVKVFKQMTKSPYKISKIISLCRDYSIKHFYFMKDWSDYN